MQRPDSTDQSIHTPDRVQVNFTLGMGGEANLRAAIEVPTGQVTVTQLLPILQGLTTRVIEGVAKQLEAEGRHISCRAGCGACCRQLVPLSLFEAEALAQWISALPEDQQQALEARFHAALLALRDKGILSRLTEELWEEGSLEAREAVIDYQAAWVSCPFLVDECCSIHPMRPLVCREYLVISPPPYCSAPANHQVEGVKLPLHLSKALYRLGAKLEGEGSGWIPLVFLFHWIKSGAQPGQRMSGPGPEVLHGIISELEG